MHGPAERRAAPDLLFRREARALPGRADADIEHLRLRHVCGIDRRAAVATEALRAFPAAFSRLDVDFRVPGELELFALRRNDDSKGRAGQGLAVGAMAYGD